MTLATASDEDLAARAAAGDQAAMRELVERHLDKVVAVCRRITGNRQDAEDAAQEALIAAYRHIGQFRAEARFSTWLYTIASRTAVRLATRRRLPQTPLDQHHEQAPGHPFGPDDSAAARVDLDRALDRLHPEFRAALVLRESHGLSYAEIGEILRIPEVTARTRTNRAYKALAALLRDPEEGARR